MDKVKPHEDLQDLIGAAHTNKLSLALFKPNLWQDFVVEEVDRNWDETKLARLENERRQGDLFKDAEQVELDFQIVRKLPYKFSYQIEDKNGKVSKMMIEDWEIGALYWNCFDRADGNEEVAIQKVREKYWDKFIQDRSVETKLILGTTLEHHNRKARNPFVIIGVLPLPSTYQPSLF